MPKFNAVPRQQADQEALEEQVLLTDESLDSPDLTPFWELDPNAVAHAKPKQKKAKQAAATPPSPPKPEIVWPKPDVLNYEEAPAYEFSDKLNLATRALTSFMSEKRFYESAEQSDSEIIRLFEKVVQEDPEFCKGLLLTVRRDFHMRSVSHVLAAELTRHRIPDTADLIAEICERPDDMVEILAYYTSKYGDKALPNSLKKGLAKAFRKFNEYQLAKYNKKGKIWLRDILRIAHPKPTDEKQAALWGRVVSDTLATPETWEVKISKEGSSKESWSEMIDSGKMGYMAILRNLRNFLKNDVSMEQIKKVAEILKDPKRVAKSKQLPFRFFSAFRTLKQALKQVPDRYDYDYYDDECESSDKSAEEGINLCKAEVLFDALEEAARLATKNMPQLEGKTAIACDVSSSMQIPISKKSTVENFDIGLVLGALANGFSEEAITGIFGNTWKEIELDQTKPLTSALEMRRREGEVGYSTNGYKVIEALLAHRRKVDRILFFTDCQMYDEKREGLIGNLIRQYRREINSDLKLYFFDLSGYGDCVVPESDPQTMIVGGWSEKLFDIIPSFEDGDKDGFIDGIRENYEKWQEAKKPKQTSEQKVA